MGRLLVDRVRKDPGLALAALAMLAVAAIYAPTLGRGLVNYDDPWLVGSNWIVRHPSWDSLHRIWFDTSDTTRFVLGAEYLPVRDLSIMADVALWGDWYGGFHLTSLLIYLASIGLWFGALDGFGLDGKVAGIAVLVWALHPSHAESVAWIAERKGLLGAMFAGLCALSFARFRAGGRGAWLAVAMFAAAAAVWSKAPTAFAIAGLAGLELVLPARRVSVRRSLVGLAAIGAVTALAFVPVLLVAMRTGVVGAENHAPAGWFAMASGLHGFYLQLGAMIFRNAPSYAIASHGPTVVDLVLGLGALAAMIVVLARRAGHRWAAPVELRAAVVLWLFGWFPFSRLVLPLRAVLVSDRYLLIPSLGLALAVAVGVSRIVSPRARNALLATLVLAAAVRTLDAQGTWRDSETLWQRAVQSNPKDGEAWSMYAEALTDAGNPELAFDVVREGLQHSRSPRLLLRKALLVLSHGQRPQAIITMREAAEAGEPRAMSNLALLLLEDGRKDDALVWARRGAAAMPMYAPAHRAHGKVALAANQPDEAFEAFSRTFVLEPQALENRFNLALSLIAHHRIDEARVHLEACINDPVLGARAREALRRLP